MVSKIVRGILPTPNKPTPSPKKSDASSRKSVSSAKSVASSGNPTPRKSLSGRDKDDGEEKDTTSKWRKTWMHPRGGFGTVRNEWFGIAGGGRSALTLEGLVGKRNTFIEMEDKAGHGFKGADKCGLKKHGFHRPCASISWTGREGGKLFLMCRTCMDRISSPSIYLSTCSGRTRWESEWMDRWMFVWMDRWCKDGQKMDGWISSFFFIVISPPSAPVLFFSFIHCYSSKFGTVLFGTCKVGCYVCVCMCVHFRQLLDCIPSQLPT